MIIALAGKARSGKDTTADILHPLLPKNWKRTALATEIKKVTCDVMGVTADYVEEWKVKNEIPSGFVVTMREALINIGNRFREIKPTCWIDKIDNHPQILTDIRYKNEANEFHKRGLVIRIISDRSPFIESISEMDLDEYDQLIRKDSGPIRVDNVPYDYVIYNNGTLEELERHIRLFLLPYLEKKCQI